MTAAKSLSRSGHGSLFLVLTAIVAAFIAPACRRGETPSAAPPAPKVSPNAWAVVDGREITRDEVEKAYRRMADASQPLSDEEALGAKLSLLNDLILQDILIAKARTLKVEVPDSELDKAYAGAKANMADDAFQQELTKRGLTPADMRESLRRELLTQKVIEQEVGTKVEVSAQEVSDFFIANQAQFNLPEESYHVAQIIVTPARDQQIANRTGDDAATQQAAAAKVKMLMERLKAGANFGDLAMDYSEDPESAPRGGDMGLVPVSRLKQAPQQLREAVLKKTPGSANWVIGPNGVHSIVLVVAHEPAGQRDLSTPGVRDRITEGLKARKEQLLRAAYLTSVRGDAQVVNQLAKQIVEARGKIPGTPPAAPAAK